jgi:D-alanine-D-alanine ligase
MTMRPDHPSQLAVLVLYNEPVLPADHPDAEAEHDILQTAAVVREILTAAGYRVSALGVNRDPGALLAGLREHRADVVFNFFEGTADRAETEAYAAGLLQWVGVPFTGSPAETLALARNKPLTKHLLRGAGLPTADFVVLEGLPATLCPLAWPVIVKPGAQDASVGLEQASVVTSQEALERQAASLLERYGPPVLVEEFIDGRELVVGVVEAPEVQALPVAEILFLERDRPGYWPIVTYGCKWHPGSDEDVATPPRCPADVCPELAARLQDLAVRAFRLLGCRDYVRVDFRVRRSGEPFILEVNTNPDFSPTAGLARALKAHGLTHAGFTVQLVENALRRGRFYPEGV